LPTNTQYDLRHKKRYPVTTLQPEAAKVSKRLQTTTTKPPSTTNQEHRKCNVEQPSATPLPSQSSLQSLEREVSLIDTDADIYAIIDNEVSRNGKVKGDWLKRYIKAHLPASNLNQDRPGVSGRPKE
jgi:siderophore synthetase component